RAAGEFLLAAHAAAAPDPARRPGEGDREPARRHVRQHDGADHQRGRRAAGSVSAVTSLLRAVDLDKSYAGVQALRGASLELRAGEVHARVGENGAGKSTVMRMLTGAVGPGGGRIRI